MNESKLNTALDAFIGQDYSTSSSAYNELVTENPYNPYLLINSAVSDYKEQQIGSALLKLYRAKEILPRNQLIKNNIELIENKIQLNNPQIFTLGFINFTESLVIVLTFNILFLLRSKISNNKIWKFTVSFLFILSLIVSGITFIEQKATKYAFVTSISADTYSGNNEAYSKLHEVFDGQLVKVMRKEAAWSQIKYKGSLSWIKNDDVKFF